MSTWGPDRDRDADDAAQADRAEQVGFRPYSTPGGGGGSTSSSSCLVTVLVWLGVAVMMAGSFLLFGGWTS